MLIEGFSNGFRSLTTTDITMAVSCFFTHAMGNIMQRTHLLKVLCLLLAWRWLRYDHIADHVTAKALGDNSLNRSRMQTNLLHCKD